MVVDEDTGAREFSSWDTTNATHVAAMTAYLRSLSEETIVVASKQGIDTLTAMDEQAYLIFEGAGSQYIRQVAANHTWSMVGYMGAEEGSVEETLKDDLTIATSNDVAYVKDGVHPVSYNSDTKIDINGDTYELVHDRFGILKFQYEKYFDVYEEETIKKVEIEDIVYNIIVNAEGRPIMLYNEDTIISEAARGTIEIDGRTYAVAEFIAEQLADLTQEQREQLEVYSAVYSTDGSNIFLKDDVAIEPELIVPELTHVEFKGLGDTESYMNFDGTDGYIDTTLQMDLGDPNFVGSVEFWATGSGYAVSTERSSTSQGDMKIRVQPDGSLALIINHMGVAPWQSYIYGTVTADTREWNHYAAVFDGPNDTYTLYVNGVPSVHTLSYSITTDGNFRNIEIGRWRNYTWSSTYFNGDIDEAAFYNKTLTREEILSHKGGKLTSTEDGMVAYYSFDDGTATDVVGGYNGTLYGGITPQDEALYQSGGAIITPYETIDALNDFTASFRVRLDTLDRDVYLLDSDGTNELDIYYDIVRDEWNVLVGGYTCTVQDDSIEDEAWHMVTVTRENDAVSLYIDGILAGGYTTTATVISVYTTEDYKIGRSLDHTVQLVGSLYDISIWQRALSAGE
ncbi:MAG: LamG-like jellyroll fold domain-containing protein, partial [Candidatus Omnitrophota bacterium]